MFSSEVTKNTDTGSPENNIPLVIDLDGTLIKTDLLYEGVKMLLRKNLLNFFSCFLWLLKGKTNLKNKVFQIVHLSPESLPFNIEVLNFLKKEADKGRKIILATASLKTNAIEISQIYPIFDEIYGTEKSLNLKGKNKLNLLINHFGVRKFDYIGNSHSDLIIFASCRYSYLVNPSGYLERRANKISNVKYIWHLP